ncbi:hypothetical protein HYPSUDRAFT_205816 [Hypholoma sublateritium FD-334 SS-4]|uniref:Peptidase C14 caspase domain-containing protein n=1 Tax=Hypholoma sublateritium (strain FD-334 SS-4) TaxID=945553 RepID=A0A0D2KTK7_HYPSF|nr:hypothetical protein HYPSUDRAFT_205816 [Hypholoma sublateritium FD-334 SS-4]
MLASSSPSPVLRALVCLRLDGALRLATLLAGLCTLCAHAFGPFVRNTLRRVREALRPSARKRPKHPKHPGHAAAKTKVEEGGLKGPHHDVEAMRRVLIEKYGYYPDDIVALVDDDSAAYLQPTRVDILAQMKLLVADARDDAGHADQEPTEDLDEEDGKNEVIFSCDGYGIMDNVLKLKEELVEPLKSIKCKLTAVFDCCHSASLLDLPHSHCNDKVLVSFYLIPADRREAEMFIPLKSPVPIAALDFSAIIPLADATPARTTLTKSSGLSIDIAQCYPSPPPSVSSRAPSYAGSETAFTIKVVNALPPPELHAFDGSGGGWDGLVLPRNFT